MKPDETHHAIDCAYVTSTGPAPCTCGAIARLPELPKRRLEVAKAPCKSCPYRRDVPSGVWSAHEYDKLPAYDGVMAEQAVNGGLGLFDCHQRDGKLCAGWLGCHGADRLLAVRLYAFAHPEDEIDAGVWTYESPAPLFSSGAAAAAHGKRAIDRPGPRARRMVGQLVRKLDR